MSQAANDNLLFVPSEQNPRRKRGLSLRSQLFNKAVRSQQERNDNDDIDSNPQGNNITSNGETLELNELPNHQSTPMDSHNEGLEDPYIRKYEPYNLGSNMTRFFTHLSVSSTSSLNSQHSFIGKRRIIRHNMVVGFFLELRNQIFGERELPPTENGRVIPLSINHEQDNEYFQDLFYDEVSKSLVDERKSKPYCDNSIRSSKYTFYTFLPKQLKAQFSKVANCYFMIVAIMQMIPGWSTTGKFTTIIPLCIFISISIAREGFDDWKRHIHDKEENLKKTIVIKDNLDLSTLDTKSIATIMTESIDIPCDPSSSKILSNSNNVKNDYTNRDLMNRYNLKEYRTKWKDVKVGDIIKIQENEWIPADILLLATSNEKQEAYVETMALDGETNLKVKFPHIEISKSISRVSDLKNIRTLITVEDPNLDLYNFEGHFKMRDETYSLGPDNVAYRGSILRNVESVIGLVIFSGEETKIRMNNIKNPRVKAPKLQRNINYIVLFMVCVVILLSAFSTMAERLYYKENREKAWYLYGQDAGVAATLMGFIIMYNTLIPLSLYVTMEIIKIMQLFFLQFDIDMYHVDSNKPAEAKTATILEELGQVSYIFSDKTGTLTDNSMLFRKFSIAGTSWIHDPDVVVKDNQTRALTRLHSKKSIEFDDNDYQPRMSTTSIVRDSVDIESLSSDVSWKPTAFPSKIQDASNSTQLLKYIQRNPNTLFSKQAKFFLLSISLCHSCLPKRNAEDSKIEDDGDIAYSASSPDELALIEAARDLGFVVFDRNNNKLSLRTYPNGFDNSLKVETYEILDIIEFSSNRKRMSIIVRFPDNRICMICKGADNVILERLGNSDLAKRKAIEISNNTTERKNMEADLVLQTRFSQDVDSRKSLSSLRHSIALGGGEVPNIQSIDSYLMDNGNEIADIAYKSRKSLHSQQAKKYSIDKAGVSEISRNISQRRENHSAFIPNDNLCLNEEFVMEKTLEHVEEFSTEGLRTLLYSYKWINEVDYESWARQYNEAKVSLTDRSKKIEETGEKMEINLNLLGATAIEDKLQDGVEETIDKLRRANIKLWMLTGDKRETAINIGYSCRLIKDYSTLVVISNEEPKSTLIDTIKNTKLKVKGGNIAHCVVVIDGSTLADIEGDESVHSSFIELCVLADSAICCRASPSQKANMVSAIRNLNKKSVTLAIGDGANDIAMIQSADIGIGITGKEGLQAARSADYAIGQFRFLLKLLLVNGRYNYVRTCKFVLCTFYKELLFYLTQAIYQRNTLFSGSSMYESWSLSMFNTLFTSLPVLCVGMFDKDLRPSTLLAVPELYAIGREYQAFNITKFIGWMLLGAAQSVIITFLAFYAWGFTALSDSSILPLGTMVYGALVFIINAKCELIEMQNRQWLAFAAFIISVGGYGLWNVLIMFLYRSKESPIFFVAYGLLIWGKDQSWWAGLLILITIPLLFDIFYKILKFMFYPSDTDQFKLFERDIGIRRIFEEKSYKELYQGWTFDKDESTTKGLFIKLFKKLRRKLGISLKDSDIIDDLYQASASQRKRAGTNPSPNELPPSGNGVSITTQDSNNFDSSKYDVLPSGKRVRVKLNSNISNLKNKILGKKESDEDVEDIINKRLQSIRFDEN